MLRTNSLEDKTFFEISNKFTCLILTSFKVQARILNSPENFYLTPHPKFNQNPSRGFGGRNRQDLHVCIHFVHIFFFFCKERMGKFTRNF